MNYLVRKMDILSKTVKVTKSGGNQPSKKVTIPAEMVSALDIHFGDKVSWTLCVDDNTGEKYLKLHLQ